MPTREEELRRKKKRTPAEQAEFAELFRPSPEETAERKEAGRALIGRREKLKAQGLSQREATAQAAAEQEGVRVRQRTQEEVVEERAALGETLEEAGVFEEVTPEEVPLVPAPQFGEEIPIIGPGVAALQSVFTNAVNKGWLPIFETKEGEEFPAPITPESLREGALREVRQESFNEGISISESFGSLIESIPVLGGLASRYAGNLIEAPSSNAENVIAEISKIKEAASTGQEKVRNGLEDPGYGLERARSMEEDIAVLEGRLKLLINSSAVLRANTDETNRIQEEILESREKVARYRQASEFGLTAQLTGTGRIVPTDEQIYFELKRIKEKK